jgi:hypothetical protein
LANAQTKTHCVTYGATMYYRDLTRAAPIVQREIDLVHTAATGDALTVYLWWMTRRSASAHTQHIQGLPEREGATAGLMVTVRPLRT